jgi:mono/diheme cytochrome c family protein
MKHIGLAAAAVLSAAAVSVVAWAAAAPDGGNQGNGRLGASVDPIAAERGAELYRPSCGFCHGAEGRGAQGPNLHASLFVMGDPTGKPLHDFLQVGRPAAGMPPFPQFTADQVRDLTAFLQRQAQGGRRRNIDPSAILVGDAQAGRTYFEG